MRTEAGMVSSILNLRAQGMGIRAIARTLNMGKNTVKKYLNTGVKAEQVIEIPAVEVPEDMVEILKTEFKSCKKNAVRMQEILTEKYDRPISYSTLTRWIRAVGLREAPKRVGSYHFAPGEEMQHDTSPHRLAINGKALTAQCASLTLGHSRMLFAQYYPCFTRFEAKWFLSEALEFLDGACGRCIVDNTSVILASGSGDNAVISPEMAGFAASYGFYFKAHRINHPDRKAAEERNFSYLENNFLAGRTFQSWSDLNKQARDWCIQVANAKPKRSLGLRTPQQLYVMEKPECHPLPRQRPPDYQALNRIVDTAGYVHLDTVRYSVPERLVSKRVILHKHPYQVKVYFDGKEVAVHERELEKKYARLTMRGHHQPFERKRRNQPTKEEQTLSGNAPILDAYIAKLKKRAPGRGARQFKRLLHLKRTYPSQAFLAAIEQAEHYGLFDLERLERLILERVAGDFFSLDTFGE